MELNSILLIILGIFMAIIGWFARESYRELSSWREEFTLKMGEMVDQLHSLDKRIYRIEILNPQIPDRMIAKPIE